MVMVILVIAAVLSMMGAWLLPVFFDLHRAAHVHLAFALGVMPLIMGAMTHFVPVLTRSRAAPRSVEGFAALAWIGGALIVVFFIFTLPEVFRITAAFLGLSASIGLAVWQARRALAALGGAHPGLRWYLAALACLGASLLAVLAMSVWPQQMLALKRLHLHLNLFGFVGLSAVGTMQVLLPTAAGHPDPQVATRLRADLPAALERHGADRAWCRLVAASVLAWVVIVDDSIEPFDACLAYALPHRDFSSTWRGAIVDSGTRWIFHCARDWGAYMAQAGSTPSGVAHLFVFSFLFPLVSGAAGQLFPLWLRPGHQTKWHERARRRLTFAASTRAATVPHCWPAGDSGFQMGELDRPCRSTSICLGDSQFAARDTTELSPKLIVINFIRCYAFSLPDQCIHPAISAARCYDVQPQPQIGSTEKQRGRVSEYCRK